MVEHDGELGQRPGQVCGGAEVARPRVRHVVGQATLGEQAERGADGRQREEVVARVVVHEVAHAAERRVGGEPVELGGGDVRGVQLHPPDDAGHPVVLGRDLEQELGVDDRVLGLHQHRPVDAGRGQLAGRPLGGDGRCAAARASGVIHE